MGINQKTHDTWAWDVKPPGLWKNGLPVPKAGGNAKRARTSIGKRRMRGGEDKGRPASQASSRVGSGMDKAAVKAVLASNAKLMGQMSAIRHRLSDVNNVIDDAETDPASPTTAPNFDQVHHERLRKAEASQAASARCPSEVSANHRAETPKGSGHKPPTQRGSGSGHKPPTQRASTPIQYISTSARRLLGPAIPYTNPSTIPGVQKIGVQRGAGENGQMRGDGKTTVTFCEAPNSLSHRMGMMHRTHNMSALGDSWKGRACNKILPFHSFKLDHTRAELLQEGVVA